VAGPLQFGPYYWDLQANGEGYQGGGAFIRPRDLLKLGQAYVDGGVWNGRRIVPAGWVKQSTAPRIEISPATTGMSAEDFPNAYFRGQDGYAWHLGSIEIDGKQHKDYAATGNGGQLLIVVPDYDLVVVFTAGNYMQGGIWNRFRSEIVPKEIVPAIKP
jgi:CubicO group peptidase (beta-lactamase class C family)